MTAQSCPLRTLRLYALDYPPAPGGIQTLTAEVYARLADLVCLAVAPAADPAFDPIPPPPYPLWRSRYAAGAGWRKLRFLLDANRELARHAGASGLLHCNHLLAGWAAARLRRQTGLRYIVWAHGAELGRNRFPRIARASLGHASAILANSAFTAACVRDLFAGVPHPPIHIVPLGAPPEWVAAPPHPRPTPPEPLILTVARLSRADRYKGVDTALRSLALLRRRGYRFRYRIVGDGDDRAWLESLARAEGIAAHVDFAGRLPSAALRAAYDACDLFLLCCREETAGAQRRFEGFGIVLVEAAARARPAVAGHSGGSPDAVLDGETGLLVDPASPSAVADAVAALLNDPARRARLGAAARERVRSLYNWDACAARVRAVHEELLR